MRERKAGTWYAYIAENGLNQTGLGIAVYDDRGELAQSLFDKTDEAIRRGDLPDSDLSRSITPTAPPTKADMERRLESMSNAMSMAKWTGGLPTMVFDALSAERLFNYVTGRR